MSHEHALFAVVVLVLVAIFFLRIGAWRETWSMEKQHQATVDQESVQRREFNQLVDELKQKPLEADSHDRLMRFCMKKQSFADDGYRAALDLVSQTGGEATVRELAYEMGRRSFGLSRRDGRPTVADERTIQDDIQNRC